MVMNIGFGDLRRDWLQGLGITWGLVINVVSTDPLRPTRNPDSEILNPKSGSMLGILIALGVYLYLCKMRSFLLLG